MAPAFYFGTTAVLVNSSSSPEHCAVLDQSTRPARQWAVGLVRGTVEEDTFFFSTALCSVFAVLRHSALSSSLSRISAAEIMTPNRPPASPAPVAEARPVPPDELPRVRKREDLRQNQTVMAAMLAEIVEEHLSPHRRPSRTRIPALCKTSATLINQEEAVHFRIHSTVQSGANELRTPVETLFQV